MLFSFEEKISLITRFLLFIKYISEIIIPNIGPKKAPNVSTIDKIPILLKNGNQNSPTKNPKITIIIPELFND